MTQVELKVTTLLIRETVCDWIQFVDETHFRRVFESIGLVDAYISVTMSLWTLYKPIKPIKPIKQTLTL